MSVREREVQVVGHGASEGDGINGRCRAAPGQRARARRRCGPGGVVAPSTAARCRARGCPPGGQGGVDRLRPAAARQVGQLEVERLASTCSAITCRSGVAVEPPRVQASVRASGSFQPGSSSRVPCQVRSGSATPLRPPVKNAARHSGRWVRGRRSSAARTAAGPAFASTRYQSNQPISLSWQYALLLPCWVRRNSSPATEHRHAPRQHQQRGEVLDLPGPQGQSRPGRRWGPRRRSSSSCCRRGRRGSLAVGVVVLAVVRDEVVEGEPVVAGDEVDAVRGAVPARLVQVGAAGRAGRRRRRRCPARRARSGAWCPGSGRSTPPTGSRGSDPPRTRRPRPRPRR